LSDKKSFVCCSLIWYSFKKIKWTTKKVLSAEKKLSK
jgi:hypothetical protein